MDIVFDKLSEIENGKTGIIIYSQSKKSIVCKVNGELRIPLASAAKVAIAYSIAKWVEKGKYHWNDIVNDVHFNPDEDSKEIYPHFQSRNSLQLRDMVEVMIACHDSFVANRIVQFCGGWDVINRNIQSYFPNINVTQDPTDFHNSGELIQVFKLLHEIYAGFENDPVLWTPVVNGLVRQQEDVEGIPTNHLNHMTGGLKNVIVDIGVIGEFSKNPFIYVLGAKNLPNRYEDQLADEKIVEAMKLLYDMYLDQNK